MNPPLVEFTAANVVAAAMVLVPVWLATVSVKPLLAGELMVTAPEEPVVIVTLLPAMR